MSSKDGLEKDSAEVSFKVIENMYFMSNTFLSRINEGNNFDFATISDIEVYANPILKFLRKDEVTKTILYMVYNHALNRREKGKDLFIVSNVTEIINSCDNYIQSIFNRALAQLGINAFCQGSLH